MNGSSPSKALWGSDVYIRISIPYKTLPLHLFLISLNTYLLIHLLIEISEIFLRCKKKKKKKTGQNAQQLYILKCGHTPGLCLFTLAHTHINVKHLFPNVGTYATDTFLREVSIFVMGKKL